jgi:hypothetical protein
MEKKFTIRYNALVTGLRLVIIIIAEPKARAANKRVIMFSAFHFIVVIRKVLKHVPGAGIGNGLFELLSQSRFQRDASTKN